MKIVTLDGYLFFNSELLSNKPIFVEIGSFTGNNANKLTLDYTESKIIIYEASKSNFNKLLKSTNNRIKLINKAISNFIGYQQFYDYETPSSNSLYDRTKEGKKITETYKVNVINIEEVFKENNLNKIDVLLLNCEGSEREILKDILDKNLNIKQICLSFHPKIYEKNEIKILLDKAYEKYKIIKGNEKYHYYLLIKK